MGVVNGGAGMLAPSALPGFAGQSHLYHIGATGFFLDHPQHIELTLEQQRRLAEIKEQTMLQDNEANRRIEAAEQRLWTLTGADEPQIGEVEKAAREIGETQVNRRLMFIRAVGTAASVLSEAQCQQLVGMAPADSGNQDHH